MAADDAGEVDVRELRAWWEGLVARLGLDVGRSGVDFEMVVRAYGGADRTYHGLAHLKMVVGACRGLAEQAGGGTAWDELEAGLWFHDVVYDGRRTDNEAESARVAAGALGRLGLAAERVKRIEGIIRATRHDGSAATEMERLACDIDLLPLAEEEGTFHRNTDAIREEYRHVSDEAFRAGRLAFLEKMLGRGRVFYGEAFEREYGGAARRNMLAAVERLKSGARW